MLNLLFTIDNATIKLRVKLDVTNNQLITQQLVVVAIFVVGKRNEINSYNFNFHYYVLYVKENKQESIETDVHVDFNSFSTINNLSLNF